MPVTSLIKDRLCIFRRGLQSFSDMDMTPYFFETPPVTIDTWETQDFEFVLIAAREFLKANAERGYVNY